MILLIRCNFFLHGADINFLCHFFFLLCSIFFYSTNNLLFVMRLRAFPVARVSWVCRNPGNRDVIDV